MNNNNSQILKSSILVVAHPDDEALWFSSIVEKVEKIIFCFMKYPSLPYLGYGRQKVVSNFPLTNILCLEINEAESFNAADWRYPLETYYGLKLVRDKNVDLIYQQNYHTLLSQPRTILPAFQNVFTHNPWGEYGHEDHVQIYRVIKALQQELNFNLWYTNYCGNRSVNLMFQHISGYKTDYITLKTNALLSRRLADLYIKNNCWTWYKDYQWFTDESLINETVTINTSLPYGHFFPINMLKTDFPDNIPKNKGISHKILKKIKRKLRFKR